MGDRATGSAAVEEAAGSLSALGGLALAGFAIHAAVLLGRGLGAETLWACHVAALLVGIGLLLRAPMPVAIGVSWLCVGTPAWILECLGGGERLPTSALTHLGGLGLGVLGVRALGWPQGSGWRAFVALFALLVLCRAITPPADNVNMVYTVWPRLRGHAPAFGLTATIALALHALVFLSLEARLAPPTPHAQPDRRPP